MTAQLHAYILVFGESRSRAGHYARDEGACAQRGSQGQSAGRMTVPVAVFEEACSVVFLQSI
jgi:hypothetical protein